MFSSGIPRAIENISGLGRLTLDTVLHLEQRLKHRGVVVSIEASQPMLIMGPFLQTLLYISPNQYCLPCTALDPTATLSTVVRSPLPTRLPQYTTLPRTASSRPKQPTSRHREQSSHNQDSSYSWTSPALNPSRSSITRSMYKNRCPS